MRAAPDGPIAVIATEGTVNGGAYQRAIHARAPGIRVIQQACPLFVPIAEEGLIDGPITRLAAEHYLKALFANSAERPRALVLGCTHFPVLKDVIASVVGPDVTLVDSAATTADAVARLLTERNLASKSAPTPRHEFLATDSVERFARVGRIFLGRAPEQRRTNRPSGRGIIHPHEIKPLRRRDRAAFRAIARGERARHIARLPFAFADKL